MAAGDVTVSLTNPAARKCAIFDGVDDVITVADDPSLDFGLSQSFTVSMWAWAGAGSSKLFFGKGEANDAAATTNGYFMAQVVSGTRFTWYLADGSNNATMQDTDNLVQRTWYHVVGTCNRSTNEGKLYINGVEKDSDDISAVGTIDVASSTLKFGRNVGLWKGALSDIRIYNKVLSATEIAKLCNKENLTDGLISRWDFMDGTYNDTEGRNNGSNSGARLAVLDDAVGLQVSSQRATSGDIFVGSSSRSQVIVTAIEET